MALYKFTYLLTYLHEHRRQEKRGCRRLTAVCVKQIGDDDEAVRRRRRAS